LNALLRFLDRLPKATRWVIAVLFMLGLGVADFLTGFEVSFAFLYVAPVSLAAWSLSRPAGLILSTACAATWLVANLFAGEQFSHPLIPFWNAATRAVFFVVVTLLLSELRQRLEHERQLSRTDFLTGALNRRAFFEVAAAELARADRYQHPLSIIYIDLDDFKAVNDQLGHSVGDALLRTVASTIARSTRAIDATARMGGDEFIVLMPETGQEAARLIAPRLQGALLKEMQAHQWPVTFSLGALTCNPPSSSVDKLIGLADHLMYAAKRSGKNAIAYSTGEE
jgi:diguanylate cyclase (GGDEF)-like protein